VPAGHLQAGDLVTDMQGTTHAVEEIIFTNEHETVYNIRVADFHTYFIGSDDWGFNIWVHNQYGKIGTPVAIDNPLEIVPAKYRDGLAELFEGGPEAIELKENMTIFRHWGGTSNESNSPWYSLVAYARPGNARRYLSLPDTNTAENITEFTIKKGTKVLIGKASARKGVDGFGEYASGQGVQLYVPNFKESVRKRG
jgi:Pretoxin HINT domain